MKSLRLRREPSAFYILHSSLFQAEHILHVVKTGRLRARPFCSANSPARECLTTRRCVRQFHALALRGKNHRVITDDIAASNCVHADLRARAFADNAMPAMSHIAVVLQ